MKMDDVIARINELAHKAKAEGLTPEELTERDKLRRIYIDSVKANLVGQLESTYYVDEKGNILYNCMDIDPRAKEEFAEALIEVQNNLSRISEENMEVKHGL